jgi:hypothetical protein
MEGTMIERAKAWYRDGTAVKTRVVGDIVTLFNDTWMAAVNYAGDATVNLFKVNVDDEIEVGATLITGPQEIAEDSGAITMIDFPVSATPAAGLEQSYTFKIDGNNLLTVMAEADHAGSIQNIKLISHCGVNLKEITTPTAKADFGAVYTKADNKLYFQDGAGAEHEVAFVP